MQTLGILMQKEHSLREIRGCRFAQKALRLPKIKESFCFPHANPLGPSQRGETQRDRAIRHDKKKMESRTSFLVRLLLLALLPLSFALKFDIQAHPGAESASKERCIRNFVAKDQLVVVTATISGHRGDGQVLNLHVSAANKEKS
jgi:hypothetical protein